MTVRALAENRKILADSAPIHAARCNLVHTTICSTGRYAPLYSGAIITFKQSVIWERRVPSSPYEIVGRFCETPLYGSLWIGV